MKSQLTAAFNMLWIITGDNMDAYIIKHVYTSSTSSAPLCTFKYYWWRNSQHGTHA